MCGIIDWSELADLLKDVANQYSVEYVDILPYLQKEESAALWVTPEDPHPNAHANDLIAHGPLPCFETDSSEYSVGEVRLRAVLCDKFDLATDRPNPHYRCPDHGHLVIERAPCLRPWLGLRVALPAPDIQRAVTDFADLELQKKAQHSRGKPGRSAEYLPRHGGECVSWDKLWPVF